MTKNYFMVFSVTVLWGIGVAFGFLSLVRYDNTPGLKKSSPTIWPENSEFKKSGGHELLLFVHPHCPCTNATFEELKVILRDSPNLSTRIVFMVPREAGEDWLSTSHWEKARGIPNASLYADFDAKEAQIFGVGTSGHTLLYGPKGNLLFSGGITIARGHVGNSPGRESILAHSSKKGRKTELASTPVFGCSLLGD